MNAPRRFNSLPEAKRYVYDCLAQSLEADIDNGSDFIFEEHFSGRDQERLQKAARQVLDELCRKAQPRRS